jgi:dihydroorotate dehydrogenase
VSSPNTPGLRALQGRDALAELVGRTRTALAGLPVAPPLLLKIAPDLTDDDLREIVTVALEGGLEGMIISNTTIARPPGLTSRHRGQAGGLSGQPLFEPSTHILRRVYALTAGRLPLIGVGGIATPAQAYAKIRAGASLLQLYTALVYRGIGLTRELTRGLAECLRRDAFRTLADAVGADHRAPGLWR